MRALLLLVLLAAVPARAHHRQSPPVIPLTTSGDIALPRVPAPGQKTLVLVRPGASGREVVGITPFRPQDTEHLVFASGDNDHPTVSARSLVIAWDTDADPLAGGAPGRQVVVSTKGVLAQAAVDPTGTSSNPALDPRGLYVAFESTGDLAATGNPGARQVFLRRPDGSVVQVSRGVGTSRDPVVNATSGLVAFASTSDPLSGADTGIEQIWLAPLAGGPATVVTSGQGPSTNPGLSNDGRVLTFESRAALAGGGEDTGTSQVFAYDTLTATFAQLTSDATDCTGAVVSRVKRDWRIAFVCGGEAFFYMLRADQRLRVQTDGGDTSHIAPQYGIHFVVVSTTADLVGGGTTPGHRAYVVNLWKRPPEPVPGLAVWFPSRGIPSL